MRKNWQSISERLVAALKPYGAPIGISFLSDSGDSPFGRRDDPYPEPNEHGRTGQVPAGCVFWMRAVDTSFTTTASDHANCSVGSLTHGFLTLEEAATKDDVGAVLESGWVDEAAVGQLPVVKDKPGAVVYGPLKDCVNDPDVALVRINGLALMTLKDAIPDLQIEGKPQCHIIAIAKEQRKVAASVGCALSRSRTGMKAEEMTCAIPAERLETLLDRLQSTVTLNRSMASYASADAKRFQ
jgi:uncharacterized protein (DUF169 family)